MRHLVFFFDALGLRGLVADVFLGAEVFLAGFVFFLDAAPAQAPAPEALTAGTVHFGELHARDPTALLLTECLLASVLKSPK
jgi:hypothetical protein